MDLVQEKARLQALDEYGVKTTRQWNEYHAEWDRQHPGLAVVKKVLSVPLFILLLLLGCSPVILPIIQLFRG
jgi:hypothetical protein